jgi:hypothetical protein
MNVPSCGLEIFVTADPSIPVIMPQKGCAWQTDSCGMKIQAGKLLFHAPSGLGDVFDGNEGTQNDRAIKIRCLIIRDLSTIAKLAVELLRFRLARLGPIYV